MHITIRKAALFLLLFFATVLNACEKTNMNESCDIHAKWQLTAKSSDGINWQPVTPADIHTLEFTNAGAFLFTTNTSACSGTFTLTGDELVTDLGNCSPAMYFAHRVMLQNAGTMVLRPNSGATLPYVKYIKIK